ncbi:MAG: DoxX family protein [Pirellulales bacterium]
MSTLKTIARWILALGMIGAGVNHFVDPAFYVKIMPPYLPWHLELVYISGVAEIAGGFGLLVSKLRRAAAWGLIALFVAIFPANIYVYQHQELIPEAGPTLHLLRLPLQAVLIAWAWWHTSPDGVAAQRAVD